MTTQYYEVVFEGHHKAIIGFLEGFILAGGNEREYFFSSDVGIKSETFAEVLLEWIAMRTKLQYVIMTADFTNELQEALKKKNLKHAEIEIKSVNLIKEASFVFEAKTFGKPYAADIKALLNNLPDGVQLHNYNPVETNSEEAKGVELYSPAHDFCFEAKGMMKGDIAGLIELRKKIDEQPLIEMKDITITF